MVPVKSVVARLPSNEVAVMTPVILTLPVPVISLLLRSKSPPSCGVVSVESSVLAETPVRLEPSPAKLVAVTVPSTSSFVVGDADPIPIFPSLLAIRTVPPIPTSSPRFT